MSFVSAKCCIAVLHDENSLLATVLSHRAKLNHCFHYHRSLAHVTPAAAQLCHCIHVSITRAVPYTSMYNTSYHIFVNVSIPAAAVPTHPCQQYTTAPYTSIVKVLTFLIIYILCSLWVVLHTCEGQFMTTDAHPYEKLERMSVSEHIIWYNHFIMLTVSTHLIVLSACNDRCSC